MPRKIPTPLLQNTINRLYQSHEQHSNSNVIPFNLPITQSGESLIDDVIALLEHPEHRHLAEPILTQALYKISKKIMS